MTDHISNTLTDLKTEYNLGSGVITAREPFDYSKVLYTHPIDWSDIKLCDATGNDIKYFNLK